MYTIIVSIVIVDIFLLLWAIKDKDATTDTLWGLIIGGFFAAFLGSILGGTLYFVSPKHERIERFDLASAHMATGVSGSFFLATGQVESHTVYSFWYKYGSGYKHFNVNEKYYAVTVYEDATPETAYEEQVWKVSDWGDFTVNTEGLTEYRFHVPPNSVVQEFNFGQ